MSMQVFRRVEGGYEARVDDRERETLSSLFVQVFMVLISGPAFARTGFLPEELQDDAGQPLPFAPPPVGQREGESDADAALLASLDFTATAATEHHTLGDLAQEAASSASEEEAAYQAAMDQEMTPLLEVLLPDASEDPVVAADLARLEGPGLRHLKTKRIQQLLVELDSPTGPNGGVFIPEDKTGNWLAAMNDLRLALAQRLSITSEEDAADVHALVWEDYDPAEDDGETEERRVQAFLYDLITWWQESLLAAFRPYDTQA